MLRGQDHRTPAKCAVGHRALSPERCALRPHENDPGRGARAARAPLLGWSQGYLAEGIGVSRPAIADIEGGKCEPHPATLSVLMSELTAAGIDFTERGVAFRKWPARSYVPTGIKSKIKK
jgi:DNA-binding XRE family transcriptional regulator